MKKKAISKNGKALNKIRKAWRCNGCGRVMPKTSWVLTWNVWIDFKRNRFRFCSDCQDIIYNCEGRESINHQRDKLVIRDLCLSCDSYPVCEKVEYLRKSKSGDLYMGDLEIYQKRWSEDGISADEE